MDSAVLNATPETEYRIPSEASIGHVHLKVSDLERSLTFYSGVLGFEVVARFRNSAAFISAGGYHHHIGLNTWESLGGTPAPRHHPGLYHVAIRYPSRPDLATAVQRILDAGVALRGASDHGVSIAVYLDDPDGNGLELTWDRPREDWPRTPDGDIELTMAGPFDLDALLREARGPA